MDILRCLAVILVLSNNILSEAVRQRSPENRYSRTSNNAAEQKYSSRYQEAPPIAWTAWTVKEGCSVSCDGQGYIEKERDCSTGKVQDCSTALGGVWWSVEDCDNGPCMAAWTEWNSPTPCSVSCDRPGYYRLTRNCSNGVLRDCEAKGGRYWDVRICYNGPCVGSWLEWGRWAACPKTCGVGVRSRFRDCSTVNAVNCTEGKSYDLQACNEGPCTSGVLTTVTTTTTTTTTTPVPALWAAWNEKVSCSQSCGPGFGEYTRTCSSGRSGDCNGNSWKVFACNLGECIVDGSWGVWQTWSDCPVTCGRGQRSRSRPCEYPDPDNQGEPCKGDNTQSLDCNTNICPVDGVWTSWVSWSECSRSCDEGDQMRTRTCSFPKNAPRGNDCQGPVGDSRRCKTADCAVDGSWALWSSWSVCTKSCGKGLKFRARTCLYDDTKPRGQACGNNRIDRTSCSENPCAVDGVWSDWSSWSQCTHTCNGGKRTRERVCTFTAGLTHGADCTGDTKEYQDCGRDACPVDGIWGAWGPWNTCSKTCGGGTQSKSRTCLYRGSSSSTPHGAPCHGDGVKTQTCKTKTCPVDARWSIWSAFGSCGVTCGGGFRIKTRTCIYHPTAPMGRNCTGNPEFSEECNPQSCPVDGTLTDWESWSHCSATCGGGSRFRHRSCHFPLNVAHGANCTGQLREDDSCNDSMCPTTTTTTTEAPVDGHWSKFGDWSDCTVTCGGGVKSRARNCTFPDHSLHGQYCPGSKNETQACETKHCPVDGHWGKWSRFGRCSVSCGHGENVKTRRCKFDNRYDHGADCTGNSTETGQCWAGDCPVDGVWLDWAAWHNCSVTCGGGTQDRTRICFFKKGVPHGKACMGDSHENQTCATDLCPVDGNLTDWSTWTPCPVTCGSGTQTRNRTCYFPVGQPHGDDCIGDLNQTRSCADNLCPVDGRWDEWGGWQACSLSCGSGVQKRRRRCKYDDIAPHGKACDGARREDKSCNTDKCPVDGHWSPWSRWSRCSVSCENGTHTRNRTCLFLDDVPHGNDCVGNSTESEGCNEGLCPVNGTWSAWSVWEECTVTCGNGTKSRNRSCEFPDGIPHGTDCLGPASDTDECNTDLCPIDGHFDAWSAWAMCSETCGGGSQDRQRSCIYDSVAPRGQNCTGNNNESQTCHPELCPVDGVWSEWSNFTDCTATCGNGTRFRTRICEFRPSTAPHASDCVGPKSEEEVCGTDLCPVDGLLSGWSTWTDCSKSCENGTQSHNRTCVFDDAAPHGKNCSGDLYVLQSCNVEKCPENGHWSDWSNFTQCTVSCAGGTQVRNRTCLFDESAPHGATCYGNTTNVQDCNADPCPVDGHWGDWNAWHDCSKPCGGGNKVRDRECLFPDNIPHGNNCTTGSAQEIAECNTDTCPVDGVWSDWSSWTACSASCGGGLKFHNRKCDFPDGKPKGDNCTGDESEQTVCNNTPCPVDGEWSDWSTWSQCPVTCGGGSKVRNRNCTYNIDKNNPAPHGKPCSGGDEETQSCNILACPVDGVWRVWSDFSPCTKSCGNGTSTRTRTCDYLPVGSPKGNTCSGDGMETKECNATECPQDAFWAEWGKWSDCSLTCGGGNQTRTRTCQWPTSVHGDFCPGDAVEMQSCNDKLCAVDGLWSEWSGYSTCSATCDLGRQLRNRNCTYGDKAPHGAACPGQSMQSKFCRVELCVVDGVWSQWTDWSECSVTCGSGGVSTRQRLCAFPVPGAPHGKICTGDSLESRTCDVNNNSKCAADGEWGAWGTWSTCSVTCGHGEEYRTRSCVFDPDRPRGQDCPAGGANETQSCTKESCPVDGDWLTWSTWSSCTATCGGGMERRSRQCHYQLHVPQGDPCKGQGLEEQPCNNNTCPVDGVWDTWSTWSQCTATCGGGLERRSRQCHYQLHVPQGEPCKGQGLEEQPCNNATCAVDGVLTPWGTWSGCTVTCGGGTQTRIRTCEFTPPDAPRGVNCSGNLNETVPCSTTTCPLPTTPSTTTTTRVTTTTHVTTTPTTVTTSTNAPVSTKLSTTATTTPSPSVTTHPITAIAVTTPSTSVATEPPTTTQPITTPTTHSVTTPPLTTTTEEPKKPRVCNQCLGPAVICEKLNAPQGCPLDKQYCINTLNNFRNASRIVDMRCGTRDECQTGWFEKYSSDDKCTKFSQDFIYTNQFECEFCCNTDGCNGRINPETKWHP